MKIKDSLCDPDFNAEEFLDEESGDEDDCEAPESDQSSLNNPAGSDEIHEIEADAPPEDDAKQATGRPKRPCYFCKDMQTQLARHLKRRHPEEPEV